MASEMKERIADVINRHKNTHDEPALARLILEAMRHPTEDMKGYAKHRLPGIERGTAHDVWMLMIDEALSR